MGSCFCFVVFVSSVALGCCLLLCAGCLFIVLVYPSLLPFLFLLYRELLFLRCVNFLCSSVTLPIYRSNRFFRRGFSSCLCFVGGLVICFCVGWMIVYVFSVRICRCLTLVMTYVIVVMANIDSMCFMEVRSVVYEDVWIQRGGVD